MALLLALLLSGLLAVGTGAVNVPEEEAEILGTGTLAEGLPSGAQEALEGISPEAQPDLGQAMRRILRAAADGIGEWMRRAGKTAAALLLVCVLCAIPGTDGQRHTLLAVRLAGCLGIMGICTSELYGMTALAEKTIDELGSFSAMLLPVLASALTAAGGIGSGSALYAGASLLISVLTSLIRGILVPCVYCCLLLAAAQCACGDERLERLRALVEWAVTSMLKAVIGLFTGYLTLTGLLTGTADASTLAAAKSVISSAVPVVGSMLSEASEAVLASAGVLKNAAGAFGLLAALAIGLGPFLQIAVQYLALRAAAAAAGVAAQRQHARLLERAAGAMGCMLAMTGTAVLMVMVSACAFIKAVNG